MSLMQALLVESETLSRSAVTRGGELECLKGCRWLHTLQHSAN